MSAEATSIAIAVVRHQGRVLIGQRPADRPLAGYWEFPGGKVESGETPQQAAVRECAEEAGVRVVAGNMIAEVVHRYDHGIVQLSFFDCQIDDASDAPRNGFRWVPQEELDRYAFPEGNAVVLQKLREHRAE